jgi:hypothetical protein
MVLDEDADFSGHMSVVRKLASMFRNLEEQSQFLSGEEAGAIWDSGELLKVPSLFGESTSETSEPSGMNASDAEHSDAHPLTDSGLLSHYEASLGGKVYALCEMIMEDLNNYCECMIPIGKCLFCDFEGSTANCKSYR